MRIRGAGRGWRTLSRFALIGVIGGGAAACSSDASRLSDPFTNPFSSGEPAATGSLPDGESATRAPAIRTPRIQSQALGAPAAMSARPLPAASRVASTEPVSGEVGGSVAGMNPDAGRAMTPRASAAPKVPATPNPRALEKAAEKKATEKKATEKREADARAEAARKDAARREAEARRIEDKKVEDRKLADRKLVEKRVAERRAAESKVAESKTAGGKGADARAHVRPGQTAKADEKSAKAAREAKADEAKATEAKAAREAARAEAARDAARRVAEARAAEAAAKASARETSAKETVKEASKAPVKEAPVAPTKVASAEPASTGTVATSDSFRWPAKGRVINGYGSAGNEGINIAVPEGTPVKAAEDGTVAYAGSDVKGYGKLVLVRHTNGYVSAYAHNGELDVRPGEKVKRGQTIAKSGATGNVTSPQLHFEIRKGATPVDPMPHLASN